MTDPSDLEAQLTRRAFLSSLAVSAVLGAPIGAAARAVMGPPDVCLRIGRIQVDVAPGHSVKTTGYNGSAPGPLIRLREATPVIVEIANDTDIPEYVHWHGFPVPAEIDGAAEEKSLAVPPGGSLRYRMTPRVAGSRYVHSHVMAKTDLTRGVYGGQFGFVYVESRTNPGRYDQELFLATHEWEPFFTEADDEAMPGAVEVFGETDWGPSSVEVGYRIGSINGKALGHGDPIRVKEGERILFHLLNASATENIQLELPGHEFLVTALDGNPVPRPQRVDILELGVAERVDAIVEMKNPGVWILGSTDDDVRGDGLGILLEYAGKRGIASKGNSSGKAWDYTIFGSEQQPPLPDETIPMVIERVPPDENGLERWKINGQSYDRRNEPQRLVAGRRYRLVFDNRSADAHPLHLHRNTFELTRINRQRTAGVKKDVVIVKPYQTVELDFTPAQGGLTLFHCHNQFHMDFGFKTLFMVT